MATIDPAKLEKEIALQLTRGGYATPPGPLVCAEERARAILTLESRDDIVFHVEDEDEPWDGDGDAPAHLLCLAIIRHERYSGTTREGRPRGDWLASISMVGVDSMSDPYLRVCFADLALEVLEDERVEQDRKDTYLAAELASRATYAGPTEAAL
jgi:hypothetical protein